MLTLIESTGSKNRATTRSNNVNNTQELAFACGDNNDNDDNENGYVDIPISKNPFVKVDFF